MVDPLDSKTYRWLLAWLIIIALVIAATRTRTGYVAVWYALVLMLVFLVVSQAQYIVSYLSPLGSPVPK
jgi:hypothetical protein